MISSPLRYPGGKAKLFPFFVELIKENRLFGAKYCEPYAGGAGLALRLLATGFVEKISINDIDKAIYSFWISAIQTADDFCALIENTPVTIDEWHKQKAIWRRGNSSNKLELGFSVYFLNRTNRSGIIGSAGPIGGFEQNGKWKIDARLFKQKQIENIQALSKYSPQIEIRNLDALKYLEKNICDENSFVYLDPPYFGQGRRLYTNFYEPDDHTAVAKFMMKWRKAKWVVSYDDVPEIRSAYSAFSPITYSLNYSAGPKTTGSEVIYVSDSLSVPKMRGFKVAA